MGILRKLKTICKSKRVIELEKQLHNSCIAYDKLVKDLTQKEIELQHYLDNSFVVLYGVMCSVRVKADDYLVTEKGDILQIKFYEDADYVKTISIKKELFIGVV